MSIRLKRIARHSFDLVIFVALCLAVFAVNKWFKPYKRGFFCNDESLRYPQLESTISSKMVVLLAFAIPGLVILVVELCKRHEPTMTTATSTSMQFYQHNYNNNNSSSSSKQQRRKIAQQQQQQQQLQQTATTLVSSGMEGGSNVGVIAAGGGSGAGGGGGCGGGVDGGGGYRLCARLVQCYAQLGYYLFGLGLTVLCTQLTKRCVGRLRPHFFAVCQPVLADGSTCADAMNADRYVLDYSCEGVNYTESQLKDVGQSFPSAHASIIFYSMLYVAIYLQAMLSTRMSKLLKHLLQFVFVVFAWYVSLTRISDFMHHWTDVLAGALLGVGMAIYTAIFMARLCWRRDFIRGCSAAAAAAGGGGAGGAGTAMALRSCGNTTATLQSMKSATPVLPAYTFGTLPYMQHPYTQSYHNYGYVP